MPTDIALTGLAMPLAEFPAIAREAESRGYRTAWVGEASGAEAIVLSTLIATHTTRIGIANGVIPVQTRTPIVYGQAAATLAHLAPGRFGLGLGLSSEIIVGQWHGLPFTPSIQQMREAVQIIRTAAAGERVNFEGKFYRLKNFRLAIPAPSTPPRIYLAALGPRDVRARRRGGGRRPAQLDPALGGGDLARSRRGRRQARGPPPGRPRRRGVRADLRHRRARAGARVAGPGHHRLRDRERLRPVLRGVRLRRRRWPR